MDFDTFGKITNNFNSTIARVDDYMMDTGEFHNLTRIKDFGFTPYEDITASKTLSRSIVVNLQLKYDNNAGSPHNSVIDVFYPDMNTKIASIIIYGTFNDATFSNALKGLNIGR